MLLPAKVFRGRKSINWAKSVLPVFIGDSREDPGSMLRLQIVDTGFCAETRITPGVQSGRPSVKRTAVNLGYIPFGNSLGFGHAGDFFFVLSGFIRFLAV